MEIKSCLMCDGDYPGNLMLEKSAPKSLYYAGDISACAGKVIAVIGRRNAALESCRMAEKIGALLAREGYVILNGLARGVDACAVQGALRENGKVIAVMPGGLDVIYPRSNQGLAERIVAGGGCLISEYPCGAEPQKYTFLQRDRLQVMIAGKVLVVDADESGGTMYTAEQALKHGKPVGCITGTVLEVPTGNRMLIEGGRAERISNLNELSEFVKREACTQISMFDGMSLI